MIAGVSGGRQLVESARMQGAVKTFNEGKKMQFSFYENYERMAGDINKDGLINEDDTSEGIDYTCLSIFELSDKGYSGFKPDMDSQTDITKVNPSLYKNEAYYTFVDNAVMLIRRDISGESSIPCKFLIEFSTKLGYDIKNETNRYVYGSMDSCSGGEEQNKEENFYIKIEGLGNERFLSGRITDKEEEIEEK